MERNVGVVSDTHGLLREQVTSRLHACDLIIHAGDIGSEFVLAELRQIGPVVAVRGNVDGGPWAKELNRTEYTEIDGVRIYVVHDIDALALDPVAAGVHVIVYGHSHKPSIEHRDGVLYLNPGSAGPKRFRLPVSMALLHIGPEGAVPELIQL